MLYEFLRENKDEILALTKSKTIPLAGVQVSTAQLQQGLPLFYQQLIKILESARVSKPNSVGNEQGQQKTGDESDGSQIDIAEDLVDELAVVREAGLHGVELLRLGYTLSQVVHNYGAICQAITEFAAQKHIEITPHEFHNLNRCLDVAIASAVSEFQNVRNNQNNRREVEHLGSLAHELRNSLAAVKISLELIKRGEVGIKGQTGKVMEQNLNRMGDLIDRALAEVRMRVEPKVHVEHINMLELINQIAVSADVAAQSKNQLLIIEVAPDLELDSDQQLLYSALANLVQNAIKFTRMGGKIVVRSQLQDESIVLGVEDECGGLLTENGAKLFEPFIQQNENRQGIGLGLTIARRAISLLQGTIEAHNLPGKGCIYTITIPKKIAKDQASSAKA
jgi:signal transduction histidine kinase